MAILFSVLQNTLTELKDQQRKFEEWNQLQEKIVNAQASVGQRLRSQLEYQDFRFRTSKAPPRNYNHGSLSYSARFHLSFFYSCARLRAVRRGRFYVFPVQHQNGHVNT